MSDPTPLAPVRAKLQDALAIVNADDHPPSCANCRHYREGIGAALTALAALEPKWTKENPTETGMFWIKLKKIRPDVVRVAWNDPKTRLFAYSNGWVDELDAKWCGPLLAPPEYPLGSGEPTEEPDAD